jgi:hypothetical protein
VPVTAPQKKKISKPQEDVGAPLNGEEMRRKRKKEKSQEREV